MQPISLLSSTPQTLKICSAQIVQQAIHVVFSKKDQDTAFLASSGRASNMLHRQSEDHTLQTLIKRQPIKEEVEDLPRDRNARTIENQTFEGTQSPSMLLDVRNATFPKANQTKRPFFSSVCTHSSKCHLSTIRTPIPAPECRIPMTNGDRSHRFSSKFKRNRRNQTKCQGRLDTSDGAGNSQHESRPGCFAKVKGNPVDGGNRYDTKKPNPKSRDKDQGGDRQAAGIPRH